MSKESGAQPNAKTRLPRPKSNAATVRDVAKAANVSVATVSRVLNGISTVDPTLRETVLRVAKELHYTPQAAARALALQRPTSIGAIIPTLEDPNFAVGIGVLQRRLTQAGYTLLLACSNYDQDEEFAQVRALVGHGVAGMLLVGARHATGVYELLSEKGIPFVNGWVLDDTHPCVGFDNREVGRAICNYLLDLGHTVFGVIGQRSALSDRAAGRIAGIREALAARGLSLAQEHIVERSHRINEGQLALRLLLEKQPRPTAVICGSDTLAFGAVVEAARMGYSVPKQLSITGVNDGEFAAHLNPPLTTIRLPAEEIGERVADYLLGCARHQLVPQRTPVQFSLIVRGSTAPPPKQ